MVAMAATAGLVSYAVAGSVAWLAAVPILLGGLLGAVLGSALVKRLRSWILQIAFAGLLVAAAVRLLTAGGSGSGSTDPAALTPGLLAAYAMSGLAMGVLSALFGIGGGILLVPLLVALFGYDHRLAAGTSLAVRGFIALIGAIRQKSVTDWRAGVLLGAGGVVGGLAGSRLALVLPLTVLTWLFAALLVIVAVRLALTGWRGRASRTSDATSP
jgi:uncharacterized membrane protein YfcA